MGKTYTLEDGESLLAELKSTRGKMAEMKGRLERDEITPDRNADLERQKRERAAELDMSFEEYEDYLKSLIIS